MIERARLEQRRCADWLAANGHDHLDAFLARLGASDWVGEDVMIMADDERINFLMNRKMELVNQAFTDKVLLGKCWGFVPENLKTEILRSINDYCVKEGPNVFYEQFGNVINVRRIQ